jgi:catechol 2,3-dioxygenase-like lactoylglutathione lyase family enzyme
MTMVAMQATDHVGYTVEDLAGAIAEFERLGFTVLAQAELAPFGIELALMRSGEEKVELLRLLDAEADRARRGSARLRLDHVAYRVADLDEAMAALREQGAAFVGPDDRPITEPLVFAGTRHVWVRLGELRLQLLH